MSTVTSGMHAAFLLARGREDGLQLLNRPNADPMRDAAASFWGMALALPGFVVLQLIDWLNAAQPAGLGRAFAQELLSFVIGWLAFALLSHRVAQVTGRAALWPRFITAWNWCNVVQYLMLVAAILPGLLGLPAAIGQVCWLVAMFWALWLEFFITRLAFGMSRNAAIGLVAADFGLGLAINATVFAFS
jgi:hypothetical protein